MARLDELTGASVGPYTVWTSNENKVTWFLVGTSTELYVAKVTKRRARPVHDSLASGAQVGSVLRHAKPIPIETLERIEHAPKSTRVTLVHRSDEWERRTDFEAGDKARRDHFMDFAEGALASSFERKDRDQRKSESIGGAGCFAVLVFVVAALFWPSGAPPSEGYSRAARRARAFEEIGHSLGKEGVIAIAAVLLAIIVAKMVWELRSPPIWRGLERRTDEEGSEVEGARLEGR